NGTYTVYSCELLEPHLLPLSMLERGDWWREVVKESAFFGGDGGQHPDLRWPTAAVPTVHREYRTSLIYCPSSNCYDAALSPAGRNQMPAGGARSLCRRCSRGGSARPRRYCASRWSGCGYLRP